MAPVARLRAVPATLLLLPNTAIAEGGGPPYGCTSHDWTALARRGTGRDSLRVLAGQALAQTDTGGIEGVVRDSSGGVLPGVTVEVSSPALIEGTRAAVTEGTGNYRFLRLPVGIYTVKFSLPAFATVERRTS